MKRILILMLALCTLLLSACTTAVAPEGDDVPDTPEQSIAFGESVIIVYAQADGDYAKNAALLLRESLRPVLGYRPETVTDRAYRGDGSERFFYIGNVTLLEELPALGAREFALELLENGAILQAQSSMGLYMAARTIAELWPTEEYGLKNDELFLSTSICRNLNTVDIGYSGMISVMSQNIRCANDGNGNDIADRKVRFKKLMEEYQPDLLGTQEATSVWMDIFEDYFGDEYGIVGCSRDGKTATSGEWSAILYKKSRFELVDSGTFWLTDTPNKVSMTEGALCRRICTWAILTDKNTGEDVFFANTHLDHSNDTVRGAQAEILMEFLADYAAQYPMFLTGDFNTTSGKAPYNTVTDVLADAHKDAELDTSTVKGTFHSYGSKTPNEIDFCFYNDEFSEAIAYRVLSETYGGFVSDHYGLITYFTSK